MSMAYILTNGERSVLLTSPVHRDAYVSSGWWEVTSPSTEPRVVAEAAEEVTVTKSAPEPAKRRGGRPRREG